MCGTTENQTSFKERIEAQLIEDWRKASTFWSVRIYGLILLFPDIYNGVAALGWIDQLPPAAMWCIRALAAAGIAARISKQQGVKSAE